MRPNRLRVLSTSLVFLMFITAFATKNYGGQKEVAFKTNPDSTICKAKIESGFSNFPGVEKTEVNEKTKTVKIKYNDTQTTPDAIKLKMKNLGYVVEEVKARKAAAKSSTSAAGKKSSAM
jgi:copper chaperone CopZ